MDLRATVVEKIEQLDASGDKKAAVEYFGVSRQKLAAWKRKPESIPFEAAQRVVEDFNVDYTETPPTDGEVVSEQTTLGAMPEVIVEPETAPPAGGVVPPPQVIPHMTV